MVTREFPDADWKLLQQVSSKAYERHCEASLQEIESLLNKHQLTPAEKFDEISKLTKKRSKELHTIFDTFNFSRSNALMILCSLYNWELLAVDDLKQFTPETRARVTAVSE